MGRRQDGWGEGFDMHLISMQLERSLSRVAECQIAVLKRCDDEAASVSTTSEVSPRVRPSWLSAAIWHKLALQMPQGASVCQPPTKQQK
jgi:hypothetical protein